MPDELVPDCAEEEALRLLAAGLEASMSSTGADCPEGNLLAAFLDGTLLAGGRPGVETHLADCSDCRRLLASISAAPGSDARAAEPESAAAEAGEGPEALDTGAECGTDFGPYLLLRRIGCGGMGVVYEALHGARRRHEALKRIREDLGADAAFAERFQREVRALARVSHDHIVPLYDSGRVGADLYYTMPLLPGPSLARLIESIRATGEAVPGAKAGRVLDGHGVAGAAEGSEQPEVQYARRVAGALAGPADALAALHAAGMLHRDVKPSNLVLDERHRVVLTDFGLAREEASRLTHAGEPVGTPAYMAPEQLRPGGPVDGRADVYGLGAVLYEMWTLRAPHQGSSIAETLALVLRGEVRPARALNPSLPPEADAVLARCLSSRPEDRYAGAASLSSDLRAFARGEPVLARPLSRMVRLLRGVAQRKGAIALAASLLLAAGAYLQLRPAYVTVITAPAAEVAIDGERLGSSPIRGLRLAAGPHRITARSDGFADLARTVPLERGSEYVLDVVLRPLDPADPVALRQLAGALGLERAEVQVDTLRAPASGPAAVVLWPRGVRKEAPREVVLWADEPVRDVRLAIERLGVEGSSEVLHEETIPVVFRRQAMALSGSVASRLEPGGRYRVALAGPDGKGLGASSFSVPTAAEARACDDALATALSRVDAADPSRALLRTDVLIGQGRYEEALAAAIGLRESLGDRREVARLAIAALEGAGLRGSGPWATWVGVFSSAPK